MKQDFSEGGGVGASGTIQITGSAVCRDFLRNVCDRGAKCKYQHPDQSEFSSIKSEAALQDKVLFCHDYQNSKCSRSNCKFLHCPREVENEFLQSAYLPPYAREQMITLGMSADGPANVGRAPVCKDHLSGKCARGARCKFRHITPREYDIEIGNSSWGYGNFGSCKQPPPSTAPVVTTATTLSLPPPPPQTVVVPQQPPPLQPQSSTLTDCTTVAGHIGQNLIFTNCGAPPQLPPPPPCHGVPTNPMKRRLIEPAPAFAINGGLDITSQETIMFLQQDNHHLRLQLQELDRKVSDLTAANEFLLEQNAKLRLSGVSAQPQLHHLPSPW